MLENLRAPLHRPNKFSANHPMKVYFYLKHFPPYQQVFHEGTSKAVHGLASSLVANGLDVVVLCEGRTPASRVVSGGYRVECFTAPHSSPSFLLARTLKDYICRKVGSSDLVVLNGIFHRSVYRLSRLLRQQKIPYIVAPHDPYHPSIFGQRTWLKKLYWTLFERPMLENASAIQLLDPRHAKWLQDLGVTVPKFAVPNGVENVDVEQSSGNQPFNLVTPRFVFLGRIDAYNKGLDTLIQSFSKSSALENSASLTIQGPDWGDLEKLRMLVGSLGCNHNVQFVPPDYDVVAAQLLANYDVFCLTSRFEGFGLAALEAMLAGRVILISEVAGLAPYVLESGSGVVVEPTIQGVASGIEQLLACREQWSLMGQRGRQHILKTLDWSVIAKRAKSNYMPLCMSESSGLRRNHSTDLV